MRKKSIGMVLAAAVLALVFLALAFIAFQQTTSDEYVPAADEIALRIRFDVAEDIGLLVYDYQADGHAYSGGISNADRSPIKRDSENLVVWKREELNTFSDTFQLSMQFRVITEYAEPNFENVYPDSITSRLEPVSWEARFGESYLVTITGDKTNGYKAVLSQ